VSVTHPKYSAVFSAVFCWSSHTKARYSN